jgi:hypothetical protein
MVLRSLFPYRAAVHVGDLHDLKARLFSVPTADAQTLPVPSATSYRIWRARGSTCSAVQLAYCS